jgi:hypothetical protein
VAKRQRALLASAFLSFVALFLFNTSLLAFQKKQPLTATPTVLLKRTTTRHETARLGYGGSLTIVGAPIGSITVEGWQRNEVDVTAEIELQAETEADLDKLATVNGFLFDEDLNHVTVLSAGTHDKAYMKKSFKDFPKRLFGLPWKIDFKVRVPISTDVEINAGHGPLTLSGVEGAMRISATESETTLTMTGGVLNATVTTGKVNLIVPVRSWRGSGADIRVAGGVVDVQLAPGFSGDIDADIVGAGKIVNSYEGLEKREKPGITEKVVRARAGAGGAFFKFTVGEGTISFSKYVMQ